VKENKQISDWKKRKKGGMKINNFLEETQRASFNAKGSSTSFFGMNIAHKEEAEKEENV
jgi:carbon monoxide dehydrogenase subunit G